MTPADFEAAIEAALGHECEIASCEHIERRGLFDITLKRGGSRTRFTISDQATEAEIRGGVAQVCEGLRPAEQPRRKVGGR